jgi:hypothetical protein
MHWYSLTRSTDKPREERGGRENTERGLGEREKLTNLLGLIGLSM